VSGFKEIKPSHTELEERRSFERFGRLAKGLMAVAFAQKVILLDRCGFAA
jgi:hypothetical protein